MPLKNAFEKERKRLQVPWTVLEQDYLLSWVLWGIQSVPELKSSLVFKGGTALKKIYFKDYRFSEDLDFSAISSPKNHFLPLIQEACSNTQKALEEHIPNFMITCDSYTEKENHPFGQETFTIRGRLPWHREPHVRVMVEITKNEAVILKPTEKPIIGSSYIDYSGFILTYPLEEIIAEKMRAILQNIKKYHERGWTRSRARDYYDLWYILTQSNQNLDLNLIPKILEKKCTIKEVDYSCAQDFFDLKVLELVKRDWAQWLAPLISNLPSCDSVLEIVREQFQIILSKTTEKVFQ
jgi:predicted nucleotidyltransferase component of viral defense system